MFIKPINMCVRKKTNITLTFLNLNYGNLTKY